jgi:putative oxidoreductase
MIELLFNKKRILEDYALLVLRIFMGVTFVIYATKKIQGFDKYVALFSDKLDLPLPLLNLYLVIGVEGIGGLLLIAGFFTRIVTIPLMITMVTAFFLINLGNGFAASSFGIEVPLAYISVLFVLFSFGAGKYSLDGIVSKTNKDI